MIQFKPRHFRTLAADFPWKIRTSRRLTLISVKPSGEACYAIACSDKDAIVAAHALGDLLLLAWMGQYTTDIFLLSAQDLEQHYKKAKP